MTYVVVLCSFVTAVIITPDNCKCESIAWLLYMHLYTYTVLLFSAVISPPIMATVGVLHGCERSTLGAAFIKVPVMRCNGFLCVVYFYVQINLANKCVQP